MSGRVHFRRAAPPAAVVAVVIVSLLAGCGDKGPQTVKRPNQVDGAKVSWGGPAGVNPTGVMLLIHGGGWQPSPSGYEEQKGSAPTLWAQGYATVAVAYDAGAKGFKQIVAVYKEARRQFPGLPICASGISAGGNFALMLAAREPDLDCVLASAAPTDLAQLAAQDPEADESYQAAIDAFGSDGLAKFSPLRFASKIKAKTMLVFSATDPVVPVEQGREMARALPEAKLIVVPPGPVKVEWAHFGGVPSGAADSVLQRELAFLKEALAP
jgi:dipeptidyl aminopeptidase/acylaminoacyl peptidase